MQRKESAGAPPLPSRPAVDSPLTSFPPRSASLPQHDSIQQRVNTAEVIVDDAMSKVVEHIRSEVLAATDDYTALQNMTTVARDQYAEYSEIVQGLVAGMGKVQQNYAEMDTYVNQVFDLERQVASLEQIVTELDEYTKRLEENLKKRKR